MSLLYIYNENSAILFYRKKGQRKTKTSWCISQNLIVDIWQLEKLLNVFSSNFSSLTNWFNQGPSWYLLPVTVFGCFPFSNKKNTTKSATKADLKIGSNYCGKGKITIGVTTLYWFVLSCVRAEQSTEAKARSILKEESKIEFLSTGRITRSTQG